MSGPAEQVIGPHTLREYALLADGCRGALVGPRGDIGWLCFPTWHSPAVLTALLGGGGQYSITPLQRFVWGGYYEEGTLIWRSRWVTEQGITECREALVWPGEPGTAVLLRRVEAVEGPARVGVRLDLRTDYGHRRAGDLRRDGDGWTGRVDGMHFRWAGAAAAVPAGDDGDAPGLGFVLELPAGTSHDLVLTLSTSAPAAGPPPEQRWQVTEESWRADVPAIKEAVGTRDARHAYCVLRGLTHPLSGGMVAAATTSLPERAEGGRNYDYRYVWLRDQCFAGRAGADAGDVNLLAAATSFVTARLFEAGPSLRPAYTAEGAPVPDERHVGVPGYPGGSDVVGNRANQQFQLDVFGESLLLLARAAELDQLDADGARAMDTAAAAIAERWRQPDAGIWELDDHFWTHSRLTCVHGLRAAARTRPGRQAGAWLELADAVQAETSRRCTAPSGRWQRADNDERLDGALLLPPVQATVGSTAPRSVATLDAHLATLTEDGYAYRYRHDRRPLHEAEGAFLFCGFTVALALHARGQHIGAARWFERNRAACGPPGLYSEEYDVRQRQLRGNLPQAFVHALLLHASVRLAA